MKIPHKIIRWLRKAKIQTRLFVTFLAVSLVPTLLVGLFAYRIYTDSIHQKLGDSAEQTIKQLNHTLRAELDKATVYIDTLSTTEAVQESLAGNFTDTWAMREMALDIRSAISSIGVRLDYMKNVLILDTGGDIVFDLGYTEMDHDNMADILGYIDAASPNDGLQYVSTRRGSNIVVLGRKIHYFSTGEHIGYMLIYLSESSLRRNVFSNIQFGEGGNVLLLDTAGGVVSSNDTGLLGTDSPTLLEAVLAAQAKGKSTFTIDLGGGEQMAVFDYNPYFTGYFVATIAENYITNETVAITQNLVLVMVVLVLVTFCITLVVYYSILQPIRRMVDRCNVMADEEVDELIDDDSPDELGFLARTIDHIIVELKGMAREWRNNQRRKRELELEMLQYQINPHFLFNTLNTLKWVAVMNRVPVLSEGISSLSSLLQSTLMRKDELITIAEEIENLRHYFSIQSIRFAGSFDVAYELDEDLLSRKTPRFILQPIAENSVIHGTSEGGRAILITVACYRDEQDNAVLEIRDDGQGFDMAQKPGTRREKFSGIGLTNVDERLQLYFGAGNGLDTESHVGEGTRTRITIPQGFSEKEESHDL